MIDFIFRYDASLTESARSPETPSEARALLDGGNKSFADLVEAGAGGHRRTTTISISAAELGGLGASNAAPRQEPFAIVLGCADARVPTELVFLQGANDLFVVRVAGNVIGTETIGSLDFALNQLPSIRILVVLGHSGCGAVGAAVDAFLDPAKYIALATNQQLRSIVNQIYPAARIGFEAMLNIHGREVRENPGFRNALVECAVPINAALMASSIRLEFDGVRDGRVDVVYGVYHLHSRRIGLDDVQTGLFDPPSNAAGLLALGEQIAAGNAAALLT